MVEGVEAGAGGLAAEAVAAGAGHHGLCPGQPRLGAGPAARVDAEEAGGEEAELQEHHRRPRRDHHRQRGAHQLALPVITQDKHCN